MMRRVSVADWQKIVSIEDDTPFLQNSIGTLRSGLVHVPHHFFVDTLYVFIEKEIKERLDDTYIAEALFSGGSLSLI